MFKENKEDDNETSTKVLLPVLRVYNITTYCTLHTFSICYSVHTHVYNHSTKQRKPPAVMVIVVL